MDTSANGEISIISPCVPMDERMPAEVEETAGAVPAVGLAVDRGGWVVLEAEAAVALPTTRQSALCNDRHRSR
jgi:hypothetical protein